MADLFLKRVEYAEVQFPTNNTTSTIYFPDLPNLRTAKIFGFFGYTIEALTVSDTGNAIISLAEAKAMIVNLYFDQGVFIKMPLLSLVFTDAADFYGSFPMLAGQNIIWAKSFIQITDSAVVTSTRAKSAIFNVAYTLV